MPKIILCYDLNEDSDYVILKNELLKNTHGYVDEMEVEEKDEKKVWKELLHNTLVHESRTRDLGYTDFTDACKSLSIKWTRVFVATFRDFDAILLMNSNLWNTIA